MKKRKHQTAGTYELKLQRKKKVRLSEGTIREIKKAARRVFGAGVRVFLFGSRTKPDTKGGDIDILIVLPKDPEDWVIKKAAFQGLLELRLERKVDVVLDWDGREWRDPFEKSFVESIKCEAVEL